MEIVSPDMGETAASFYISHLIVSCISICHQVTMKSIQKLSGNVTVSGRCVFIQNVIIPGLFGSSVIIRFYIFPKMKFCDKILYQIKGGT
jgi:hypothetical protein